MWNSIYKPLSIIFNDRLNEGKFPHESEKANVVPVYKKGNKLSLKNCRPISLLPICSKIFEHLIYNEMFTFFTENNLISLNQSGFRHTYLLHTYLEIPTKFINRLTRGLKLEVFS